MSSPSASASIASRPRPRRRRRRPRRPARRRRPRDDRRQPVRCGVARGRSPTPRRSPRGSRAAPQPHARAVGADHDVADLAGGAVRAAGRCGRRRTYAAGDAGADGDEQHPLGPRARRRAGPRRGRRRARRGRAPPAARGAHRPDPAAVRRGSRRSPTRPRRRSASSITPGTATPGRDRVEPVGAGRVGQAGGDVEDRVDDGLRAALGAGRVAFGVRTCPSAASTRAHLIPVPPTSIATTTSVLVQPLRSASCRAPPIRRIVAAFRVDHVLTAVTARAVGS